MWTPKRVLLLVFGLVAFGTAYVVYAHFLGRVDGLPPLPAQFEAKVDGENEAPPPGRSPILVDKKLQMAFGEDCEETRRTIKLEVRAKGVVLAADEFGIEPDGRVKLKPFSIALFSKPKKPGGQPEINTVRSDIAYLTFDQPIANAHDMGNRKIVGGELVCQVLQDGAESQRRGAGGVRITNNRSTPKTDDDLSLFTPGPVYYQENLNLIWTREPVVLKDEQTRPKPTEINAIGMDVYLTNETDAAAAREPGGRRKQPAATLVSRKKETGPAGITGVKAIGLRSDVAMHLWVDARSGFLGDGSQKKNTYQQAVKGAVTGTGPTPEPMEKAQVVIKTQGPFVYDMLTDHARFDISRNPGPHPNNVEVSRQHLPNGAWDLLICDHLELQFTRKPAETKTETKADASSGADNAVDLQIESAHAWGIQVTLTSDNEGLTTLASGTVQNPASLVYKAATRESTLKGKPVIAMKDGNEIVAQELILISPNEKEGQSARAKGPGKISLLNRQSGTRPLAARWTDTLTFAKDGPHDVLTLTGDAVFEDADHAQLLQADRLKVWLEPTSPAAAAAQPGSTPAADDPQRRRPHRVEAQGHVITRSPDMNVHDTDRLVVWFRDGAAQPGQQLPGAAPVATSADGHVTGKPAVPAPAAPESSAKPKNPIDLKARSVEAHVIRMTGRNELDKLWCEGDVRVVQKPANPQDKGVDITGETLQLVHFPEGHVLTVTGDLARVELDKLTIEGPEVNIDQKDNKAWVVGQGFMRMPSDTSLQGGEKKSEPVDLIVHWDRDMFFNGNTAVFHGGIQAEQENARLLCQELQVFLDRYVSLKQSEKNGPPAKVKKLVCDKSVRIEDTKFKLDGRSVAAYQRIESPVLSLDNEENVVYAPGPGIVRIMQPGAVNEGRPGPRPTAEPGAEEMKVTRIQYFGHMFANNNTRTAIFRDKVEVVHLPGSDPNISVNVDNLPAGAMYLRCNQLKVYSRREAGGKSNQEMEAHGKASVEAQEFRGRADIIKYDESKDLVVFEATEGNQATLYRIVRRGAPPEEIKAKKIFYWRHNNTFKIDGGSSIKAN